MTEPTGYTSLGFIGYTDKGTYSALENYVKNDIVHYNGAAWRCKVDNTAGITPVEGDNWTLFIAGANPFTGATASSDGAEGIVPKPLTGEEDKILFGDGAWGGFTRIINAIYPVGSIYMTTNSANPSTYFGGTWVAWGSGRVPVGIDANDTDFDTVEETGGAKSVTLTSAQSGVPAHSHGLNNHTHSIPALSGTAANISLTGSFTNHGSTGIGLIHSASGILSVGSRCTIYGAPAGGDAGVAGYAGVNINASHAHSVTTTASTTGGNSGSTANNTAANASQAHTNLQPYITCYMWKRTA